MYRNTPSGIAVLAAALLLPLGVAAGPLTPPAGPVASIGRTLAELETRTPINAQTCPGASYADFVITQRGHYHLPASFTTTKTTSIVIAASDVTIDLGGFTITAGPGAEYGVAIPEASPAHSNVTVRAGSVSGTFGQTGIDLSPGDYSRIEDVTVRVAGNATGIALGNDSEARRCTVRGGGTGIGASVGSRVVDCTVVGSASTGILSIGAVVEDCRVRQCGTSGISVQSGGVVRNCVLRDNNAAGGRGIYVFGTGSRIDGNTISGSRWCIMLHAAATDNLVVRNTVRKGSGTAIVMDQQIPNVFPNNHVAQIIADPASPFTATNPFANIEY